MRFEPRCLPSGNEKPSVIVVGVGGAGCNAVAASGLERFGIAKKEDCDRRPFEMVKISSTDLEVFRTTSPHLLTKVIPSVGRMSEIVDERDIVFIFVGLGGETGSHTAPVLASISRRQVRMVVSVVCLPFSVEGKDRHKHAAEGLVKLSGLSDICVVLENDGLAKAAPQLQFRKAFRVMDQVMNFVPGEMRQALTTGSLKEVKELFKGCSQCRLGVGMGTGIFADRTAVSEAFASPWFDISMDKVSSCLAMMVTGEDNTDLARSMAYDIANRIPHAPITYAARTDPSMNGKAQVTVLLGSR
ncbi:MAG: hypothetical protein HPY73_02435 [Methanomassiliicoccales archaeon]|nr:MAG: hypothetical protein HPY73_02435 [Methanomassiliicoccales archaeon]